MNAKHLRICINVILMLTVSFIMTAVSYAAFEPIAIGARPAGLGGAYTALADDIYAVYYNPAGLSLIPRGEFTAQYSQMYMGLWDKSNLSYSFVGIAQPLRIKRDFGTIGVSVLNFNADNLYKESTFILSYGKNFTIGGVRKLDVGFNLKTLSIGYGEDTYTYDTLNNDGIASSLETGTARADALFDKYGFTKTASTVDFGMKYSIFSNYKVAFMIQNITQPNIALDDTVESKLPAVYNIGFAHTGKSYALGLDYMTKQTNKISDYKIAVSGEKYLPFGMGLRSGIVFGSRELMNLAVGVGFKTEGIQFDYAIEYPFSGIKNTMGNHKVSMVLKFGPVLHDSLDAELQMAYAKEQKVRIETEQKLDEKSKQLDKASKELDTTNKVLETTNRELEIAKVEIEKLKDQLEELLKRPIPVIPVPAEQKPSKETKETGKPSASKELAPVSSDNPERQYLGEYNTYRKTADKLIFNDRVEKIKQIVVRFKDKKIDTSSAQGEYKILLEEQKNQGRMYTDSLTYYRKMVAKGIDQKTQSDLLKKIISRYEQFGIDVSEAQKELDAIGK